ncbi:MAG: pilus assembly protein, partial [Planctomycetaceae bacterium]|nr:pilus assembly protein [Planctomycetaceae bacterium]
MEMALVAPLIFMVFFAAVEFTRIHFLRHTAKNAAFEAARDAMVPGASSTEGEARGRQLLQSLGIANPTVRLTPQVILESTTSITVDVTIPVSGNLLLDPVFFTQPNIVEQVTLRTERAPMVQARNLPVPPPP